MESAPPSVPGQATPLERPVEDPGLQGEDCSPGQATVLESPGESPGLQGELCSPGQAVHMLVLLEVHNNYTESAEGRAGGDQASTEADSSSLGR